MREAAIVLALLLAGCASPAAQTIAPAASPPALDVLLFASDAGCRSFCEPNVAALPTGEWLVLGDRFTRSVDGGATFEDVAPPPSPVPGSFQTDALVQVAPDGTLFFSALVASCALVSCAVLVLEGIQVARSTDASDSWSSVFLSLPRHPNGFGADRQWLAFGPDGVVCVNFQYVGVITPVLLVNTGPEVRASCSTDGGATFPEFVSVTGVVENGVINGRPVFDAAGRYVIPYFRLDRDGALFLAISEDTGRTFEEVAVEGASGDYFPSLALDANGTFHLLWRDADQAVVHATSADARAWSASEVVSGPGETTPSSPWMEARGEGILATWFVARGEDANDVVAWDGARTVTVATGLANGPYRPAATDFAHLALAPDGRALVVFGDVEDDETRLALVG